MKISRFELLGILAAIALVIFAGVFVISRGVVHADDACDLPGMNANPDCQDDGMHEGCDLPGMDANPDCNGSAGNGDGDSMAEQINCEIYHQLIEAGSPIPDGFDGSQCDGNGGSDGGNGNGGGGSAACADGVDNDGDGKIDMDDPGCSDASDTDEADAVGGGGAGGDNSSNGGGGGGASGGGSVLGASTTPIACDRYLTAFIKYGSANDKEQVTRLQHVLKAFEGAPVEENGVFDAATLSAVHAFQTKYWDTILAPWNIKQSTGYVYLTTRKKVNEIYCKNEVKFPLTADENTIIEKSKVSHTTKVLAPKSTPAATTEEPKKETTTETKAPTPTTTEKSPVSSPIRDFFRRLFHRGR